MGDWEDVFGSQISLDDLKDGGPCDDIWEQKKELREEYEEDLRKGKFSDPKPYHNSKIHKIGFNNFKPFGEKLQTFSKKPITLIYGPNSIGKSSFIHMNAYSRYMHKTKNLNLLQTDMFGDNINLGGFSKFIHKRDKSKKLTLEYEFEDCSEAIIDYLDINQNISEDMLKALESFSISEIETIIRTSDKYIFEVFTDANIVQSTSFIRSPIDGYGSGVKVKKEPDYEKQIELLRVKRRSNGLCNTIYQKEIDLSKIKISQKLLEKSYVFSGHYTVVTEGDSNLNTCNINRMKHHVFLDKNRKFINEDTKNHFISDVLIPLYINQAKLLCIKAYSICGKFSDIEITEVAKKTKEIILDLLSDMQFLSSLQSINVSLKISANLMYEFETDKIVVSDVSYFIENELFDHIKSGVEYSESKIMKQMNHYKRQSKIQGWMGSMEDFSYKVPNIFENISTKLFNKIYKQPNYSIVGNSRSGYHKNNFHESSVDILFLSFKSGYDNLIGAFNDMLGLDEMQYIGPLRFYPERDSTFKELDSDESKLPNSQASWSYLKQDAKLRETVNKWLKDEKKLKTPYEIKYRKLYDLSSVFEKTKNLSFEEILEKYLRIYSQDIISDFPEKGLMSSYFDEDTWNQKENGLISEKEKKYMFAPLLKKLLHGSDSKEELVFEDLRNGTQISNRDLGLGISQILPILIATNRQKNMTIAVEQPELHLHPAVQCEVADEFIRSYKQNKNNFLIETHSEHLLLRIMKRMRYTAEGKEGRNKLLDITPDDVCLLYVDSHKGRTFIRELQLDYDGSLLSKWPNGFFEESYNEMFY